jgi:hypothetical protein
MPCLFALVPAEPGHDIVLAAVSYRPDDFKPGAAYAADRNVDHFSAPFLALPP